MTFEFKPERIPKIFDQRIANEVYDLFPEFPENLRNFFAATASCSPFLFSQIQNERDWLVDVIKEKEFDLLSLLHPLKSESYDALYFKLRLAKRRAALWIAICDLADIWSLETVTQKLSEFADKAVNLAWCAAFNIELRKGKFPKKYDANPDNVGFFILAMGKLGAYELNYSSDIDLICFFDEEIFNPEEFQAVRRTFINATKNMYRLLNENGKDGYVFRTDLRLRPDPSVTPVCMGVDAAERYYASLGRSWERAAFIKARVCAGDFLAGSKFLKNLEPFIWRKYLDYAAIADAHDIRLRIRDHYQTKSGNITLPKHNMKLGRGGIRDIEFFTQTHQIIFGGRDKSIRSKATIKSLKLISEKKWLPVNLVKNLTDHYCFHRTIEHRLQMINDAQTHELPSSDQGFARLASLMSKDKDELKQELFFRLSETNAAIEGFFEPQKFDQNIETQSIPKEFEERIKNWTSFPALRADRAISIFERLKPSIFKKINSTSRPNETLKAFDNFLSKLPAGVQLFSLFENNIQILDLLIDILGTSEALSEYLVKNTAVLESVIAPEFWKSWPNKKYLADELVAKLLAETDYEAKLDLARHWCLGAGTLHANSDLDLIIIFDSGSDDKSEGLKSIPSRQYYSRLTKAFITAISAPMTEGKLYEIDMRLRPSGFQGPVATSWNSYQNYQKNEAWVWEHLALTRARGIAGNKILLGNFESFRGSFLKSYGRDNIFKELNEMRSRISQAKSLNPWDAKVGPGRLQDIDLLSQAACLFARSVSRSTSEGLKTLCNENVLTKNEFLEIKAAAEQLWSWQIGLNILFKGQVELKNKDISHHKVPVDIFSKKTLSEVRQNLHSLSEKVNKIIDKALSAQRGN